MVGGVVYYSPMLYNAPMIANRTLPHCSYDLDVRTVALVGRLAPDTAPEPLLHVIRLVSDMGKKVVIEARTHELFKLNDYPRVELAEIGNVADVLISVGGDGTMLGVAREVAPYGVPLIGINQGHLGFITDVALNDAAALLREILLNKRFVVEARDMLQVKVLREGEELFSSTALNDVVVARRSVEGMMELNVNVDDEFMYRQRADSLIIATPTGSTAYSLAANGPILHPQLAGITLVPVAPQSLSNRPIVLPHTSKIQIEITSNREAAIHCDTQVYSYVRKGDQLNIQLAPHQSIFWHPLSYNYFATLRQKLNWQLNPSRPM